MKPWKAVELGRTDDCAFHTTKKMTDFQNSENHFHVSSTLSTLSYGQEARRLECAKRYEDAPQYASADYVGIIAVRTEGVRLMNLFSLY
jgi:hypothetical protein